MPVLSPRQKAALVSSLEPGLAASFAEATEAIKGRVSIAALASALESGSVDRVISVLGLESADQFAAFEEAMRTTFLRAGRRYVSAFPPLDVGETRWDATFDIRNPRAERFLADHSAGKVRGDLIPRQRAAIRAAVEAGFADGRNPNSIALDLVGRYDRTARKRVGGLIGLTGTQANYVRNMRKQLASGNPVEMAAYFQRQRRDARFDRLVQSAINEGRPVAAADIDRIAARYQDRLLAMRGEAVARTETRRAVGAAARESLEQAVEDGALRRSQIKRIWRSAGADGKTRPSHLDMEGQTVGLDEPFIFPGGGAAMYPGDDSLDADPAEVINCRCNVEEEVDW